jgi:hypothetical protein
LPSYVVRGSLTKNCHQNCVDRWSDISCKPSINIYFRLFTIKEAKCKVKKIYILILQKLKLIMSGGAKLVNCSVFMNGLVVILK